MLGTMLTLLLGCKGKEQTLTIVNEGGKYGTYGFEDENGDLLGKGIVYDWVEPFSEGFAVVGKNRKWGFINTKGEEVFDGIVYNKALSFSEGFASIRKNRKEAFIDKNGKLLGDGFVYDNADFFSEGLAAVKKDEKWGFIDTAGKVLGDGFVYDHVIQFAGGSALVVVKQSEKSPWIMKWWVKNKWQVIDKNGKFIDIDADVKWFASGHGLIKKGDKYGIVNKYGKFIDGGFVYDNVDYMEVEIPWPDCGPQGYVFNEDWKAIVKKDGKWGYIDTLGNYTADSMLNNIPHGKKNFDSEHFNPKLDFWGSHDKKWDIKVAEKDGKYGFVDNRDYPVGAGFVYDYAYIPEVSESRCTFASFAFVYKDEKYGFADRNAKLMGEGIVYESDSLPISRRLDFAYGEYPYHLHLKKNGKWGFIDENFRIVGEGFIYDEVERFEKDLAKVKKDGKWWLIDSSGIVIEETEPSKNRFSKWDLF
ncbi:MAG: WG repeat-containing protein [Candidatus Fibromonas sp.]|jgi:hypothetical protein|nr:WG repeat-containing protein [Candidatus Fibromonas sp.]